MREKSGKYGSKVSEKRVVGTGNKDRGRDTRTSEQNFAGCAKDYQRLICYPGAERRLQTQPWREDRQGNLRIKGQAKEDQWTGRIRISMGHETTWESKKMGIEQSTAPAFVAVSKQSLITKDSTEHTYRISQTNCQERFLMQRYAQQSQDLQSTEF